MESCPDWALALGMALVLLWGAGSRGRSFRLPRTAARKRPRHGI